MTVVEAGQIVRVRSRQYLVEEVIPSTVYAGDTTIRLACLEDDKSDPLEGFWKREIDAQLLQGSSWSTIAHRGFDHPKYFSAYLHALQWNCVTSTDPKLFQTPYRVGIEVKAYQLEPLCKTLLMPRISLFIADDMGLRKTIKAGLILREMLTAAESQAGGDCLSSLGGAAVAGGIEKPSQSAFPSDVVHLAWATWLTRT